MVSATSCAMNIIALPDDMIWTVVVRDLPPLRAALETLAGKIE